MRRVTAALLVLGVVGACLSVLLLVQRGDQSRPQVSPPTPVEPRLLVGFFDDANFRWRPYRADMLDRVQGTGARIVRVLIRWHLTAPKRPRAGRPPFLEPMLYEIDELVANTTARGMEVLLSIWGTPSWANGGRGPNYAPTDPDDLRRFASGLAARYPTVASPFGTSRTRSSSSLRSSTPMAHRSHLGSTRSCTGRPTTGSERRIRGTRRDG